MQKRKQLPTNLQTVNSPVVLQRRKRRRHTLTEPSPHTYVVTPLQYQVSDENISYKYNDIKPNMTHFLLSENEKNYLKLDIHLAILMKLFQRLRHNSTIHLPAITHLVHCLRKRSAESECSKF